MNLYLPLRTVRLPQLPLRGIAAMAQALIAMDCALMLFFVPETSEKLRLALPDVREMITVYGVCFAGGLLAGGAVCDRWGPRRILSVAITLFIPASLLLALPWQPELLLAACGVTGIAVAFMQVAILVLIATRLQGMTSHRALMMLSIAGGTGLVAGGIAGIFFAKTGWPLIAVQSLPAGLALLLLQMAGRGHPEGRCGIPGGTFLPAALAGSAAVACIVMALLHFYSCGSPDFVFDRWAAVLAGAFLLHEKWSPHPFIPLMLRRQTSFHISWMAGACYMASAGGQFYLMFAGWQQDGGQNGLHSGGMLVALAGSVMSGNLLWYLLQRKCSVQALLAAGFMVSACGFFLSGSALPAGKASVLMGVTLLSGLGHGMIFPSVLSLGLMQTPAIAQGRAGAVIMVSQVLGGGIILAIPGFLPAAGALVTQGQQAFHCLGWPAVAGTVVAMNAGPIRTLYPHRSADGKGPQA